MPAPIVSGFAALSDTRIHYEVYGSGPDLILLHGNSEDLHVFDCVIDGLSAKYRVVALDMRGHGKSDRGSKPMNFDTLAQDVAVVMERLDILRAHILGFSDGGNTALHLALLAPQKVASMVLMGANLTPGATRPGIQLAILATYAGQCAAGLISRSQRAKGELTGLMVHHPKLKPEQLRNIRCPVLVMAGEHDMFKRTHTDAIAFSLPDSQLEIIPGADHFVLAKPALPLQLILAFLERQTG